MKRLIRFLTLAAFVGLAVCHTALAEHPGLAGKEDSEKAQVIQLLEIMNGDENGNMNLDEAVTRAEFVKMAISASAYKNTAKGAVTVSLFTDVKSNHWAAGYISAAVKAGWVNGYLDGSFRPENEVKLEEGVNILLKLLGYTADDVSGPYPDAQLAKYEDIDLNVGVEASKGEPLTRRDCMRLFYNALCIPTKTGAYYCTTLGYTTDADNTIDYLALISSEMTGPYVNTDDSWKTRVSFSSHDGIAVYRDGKAASPKDIEDYDVYYYSDKCKTVWCYTDKVFGKINAISPNLENPQTISVSSTWNSTSSAYSSTYSSSSSSTYNRNSSSSYSSSSSVNSPGGSSSSSYDASGSSNSSSQSSSTYTSTYTSSSGSGGSYLLKPVAVKKLAYAEEIEKDDYVMLLLDKDGAVADLIKADFALYERYADRDDLDRITEIEQTLEEPIVVRDLSSFADDIPFSLEDATILLDTESITANDIRINDVLYYSELFRSVWVFRETKSGVCTAINPNRESPTSVTVNGKVYSLSTDDIVYKFSNYGTFKTDTFVTLLLGKDGSAVDVLPAGEEIIGEGEKQTPYTEIVSSTLKGPYIAENVQTLFDDAEIAPESAIVFKNNRVASVGDIERYNVYYYSKLLSTVWVFDDTAVGNIEAISPTRVSPTSVTVSGKTYALESTAAQYAVSSLGTLRVGDRVTLLLGKDGDVAGFADVTIASRGQTVYGVIIANEKKQYTDADGKNYTSKTVTVFAANGETYTYECDGNYTVGTPVKVTMGESKALISGLSSPRSMSYALPATQAVENGWFADDVQIIDYYDENVYATVLPSRIEGSTVEYTDILYFEVNDDGELTVLILDNFTGDLVEYGLITSVNGSTYTYVLDGEETTYSSGNTRYYVSIGGAYFAMTGNQINDMGNLRKEVELKLIVGDMGYAAGSKAYPIDDDVRVYIRVNGVYKAFDLDELHKNDYGTMIGYYDKNPDEGGKIRVIVAY